jgi:putative two-component system response regulator
MMPIMDGYEVCKELKSDPMTSDIPIIFVTAKDDVSDEALGLELGAVDYISKPIRPPIVSARVRTQLLLQDKRIELERAVKARTVELEETRLKLIQRLATAAEYRDTDTGLHVYRMSHYSRLLALAYSKNPAWADSIFNAAPMHDVGKIGIPDSILLKPGKLTADEWEQMKSHAKIGAEIIGKDENPLLNMARTIALTHHEKWDGSGYPGGLAGDDIPIEGRIIAIADVFDAVTSKRCYKQSWEIERAIEFIEKGAGKHFDPALVELFHQVLPEMLEFKERYSD